MKEYFEAELTTGKLHNIVTPTMYLNAIDDPCIEPDIYPVKEISLNPNLIMCMTKRGGHCAHMAGSILPY